MIIKCPSCEASFTVPRKALPAGGRRVKCSKCSHIWVVKPVIEDTDEENKKIAESYLKDAAQQIDKVSKIVERDEKQELIKKQLKQINKLRSENKSFSLPVIVKKPIPILLKLSVLLLLVANILAMIFLSYPQLTQKYKALNSVFSIFNIYKTEQLTIAKIALTDIENSEAKNLQINLKNHSAAKINVPLIRVRFLDEEQNLLRSKLMTNSKVKIDANKLVTLDLEIANLPFGTEYIEVAVGNKFELMQI